MGRVGACADIAAMGSFFAVLQKNVLNKRRWTSKQELRLAIVTWIQKTHHVGDANDANDDSGDSPQSSLRQ